MNEIPSVRLRRAIAAMWEARDAARWAKGAPDEMAMWERFDDSVLEMAHAFAAKHAALMRTMPTWRRYGARRGNR